MKKSLQPIILLYLFGLLSFASCKTETPAPVPTPIPVPEVTYYRGMDLSFQPEIEDWNTIYYDADSVAIELLPYLKQKGVNLIRLRLWHTPQSEYNSLDEVVAYAQEVKDNDMDILLDLHFSDTWADPGKQFLPSVWENLTMNQLNDSVHNYSRFVLKEFLDAEAVPAIVQIGNETNSGFLWDQGRVGGDFDTNWPNYIMLLKTAIFAMRDQGGGEDIKVMIHYAGLEGAKWFFDNLTAYDVDFDIIGLSYYSIWHGNDWEAVSLALGDIAASYPQPIMVVETGYPFTLGWNDWTNNFYGDESQLIPGFPATAEGQKSFMFALDSLLKNLGNKSSGFCYWAPDWVAFKGPEAEDGSVWENVAVFDFNNKALPVLEVFAKE